jgi:hypothetical protein
MRQRRRKVCCGEKSERLAAHVGARNVAHVHTLVIDIDDY